MEQSRMLFLHLNLICLLFGCHVMRDGMQTVDPSGPEWKSIIHPEKNLPVLYSCDFKVLKYRFSGLIAFRNMDTINETRIVFLTEVGIRLMEFSYTDGLLKNTYCVEGMDKKSLIRFVKSFLLMLLEDPSCKKLGQSSSGEKNTYVCRTKEGYFRIDATGNVKSKMLNHKSRKRNAVGTYETSQYFPDTVKIKMPYKSHINMKLVNHAFN